MTRLIEHMQTVVPALERVAAAAGARAQQIRVHRLLVATDVAVARFDAVLQRAKVGALFSGSEHLVDAQTFGLLSRERGSVCGILLASVMLEDADRVNLLIIRLAKETVALKAPDGCDLSLVLFTILCARCK